MRLATFNILHGRSLDDDRVDLGRFAETIRELDADVLALQEVDHLQERSTGADLTAVAAEAMQAVDHRFVASLTGTPGGVWSAATGQEQPDRAGYGVALLSRYPVASWSDVRLPVLTRRVPMWFRGRRRPILVRDEPRVAVIADVQAPGGALTVVNTHLSFVPGWNVRQLRLLVRGVASLRRPLVLLGDLNMDLARAQRAARMRPLATAATFPSRRPERQLDHVLLDGWLPSGVGDPPQGQAVPLPLSDHCALVVDL